jgi:hypothetical protein
MGYEFVCALLAFVRVGLDLVVYPHLWQSSIYYAPAPVHGPSRLKAGLHQPDHLPTEVLSLLTLPLTPPPRSR